jgi:GSCFA family
MTNPYRELPDCCFWSRAMTWPAAGHIDPATGYARIAGTDRVATMGSCFAQHLARHIRSAGLNYYVAESAPAGLSDEIARARNYEVFSARYGNVYTARQAVQLFDRAFGRFHPRDDVWEHKGGFVDAFRPQIEPQPLASATRVRYGAADHLHFVREVFTGSDWLVFTLGLTEGWRSRIDGAVYPIAPGVAGGEFDPDRYEFVNFTCEEVRGDLARLVERIAEVNPRCRIILTVSPVPLIATYERRHVLVSTTFSKAALRVAADEIERRYANVTYFPSYEIVTSPAAAGRYYADDLRSVTETGVKHVMRVFTEHFLTAPREPTPAAAAPPAALQAASVICDEEAIEHALQISGFGASGANPAEAP